MKTVSIVDALSRRMALIAQAMAERVDPGLWEGYTADEGLVGRLHRDFQRDGKSEAWYHRPGEPEAKIILAFIRMTDVKEEHRGSSTVISETLEERKIYPVKLPAGAEFSEEVEHTFESTTGWSEAYSDTIKAQWEAGGKASLSAGYGGISGSIEAWGKYGEEATRQSDRARTGTTLSRDTVRKHFKFTGPIDTKIEAKRERQRESRIVKARCDFDGKVYMIGTASSWEFTTFRSQFIPIAKRIADDSIYGYDEFMDKPLSDAEIEALEAPSEGLVEFVVEYDNVLTQSLQEIT